MDDYFALMPEGVQIFPAIIGFRGATAKEFDAFQVMEDLASQLVNSTAFKADVITIQGSPPFWLKDLAFVRSWASSLEKKLGVPVTHPIMAAANAFKDLNVRKPVVASYFGPELNNRINALLKELGLEPVVPEGFSPPSGSTGKAADPLYTTSFADQAHLNPENTYRFCRRLLMNNKSADSIYIVGGGWDHVSVVQKLEEDLNTSVVPHTISNAYTALKTLGVKTNITGYGKLYKLLSV